MTTRVFTNAHLFDGATAETRSGSWLAVDTETGKIVDLGQGTAPTGDETVDLGDDFIMPGLINVHTHTMMNAINNKVSLLTEAEVTVNSLTNLRRLLQTGVTYVRECGSAFSVDTKLRALQLTGTLGYPAPGIVPSGRPMSITGGHGDFLMGARAETTWGHLVDSPDEMRQAVREEFRAGARNIKLMATGGVMSEADEIDDTELTVEEMRVAVEESHAKSRTVCAHAEGAEGIHNAIVAGVDSIEHGSLITDEDAELMKRNGQYLTPTLIAAWGIKEYGAGRIPEYMMRKTEAFVDDYFEHIGRAARIGVKISFGTDAGTPFNDFTDTPFELQLYTQVGISNEDALFAAGRNSAELLHIDDEYGTLEPGKYADFLVLDADPLADVAAVAQTDKQVYQHGERVF
jgi:imidazolonepropionase-like amidohydrolase